MEGNVALKTVEVVHTGGGNVKNYGGWCAQVELLISMGILGQGSRLTQLLKLLGDFNLVYRFFELREKVGFVLGVLLRVQVLLMPLL